MKPDNQTLELAPVPKGELSRPQASDDLNINQMFEIAVREKASVETMERMMSIRRELKAEKAKSAFHAAMANFQSECPVIEKRKSGARDAYKYAPLDDIVSQVKEPLKRNGFSYSIDSKIDQGWVEAICIITHEQGHTETRTFKVPIDTRNTMMNDPQKYAGSMTFAKRYCFCNAFGIMTADEDRDGAGKRPKPAGPSKPVPPAAPPANPTLEQQTEHDIYRKQLWGILKEHKGTEKSWVVANQFCQKHKITTATEDLPNVTVERLKEVIEKARIVVAELK